MIRKPEPPSDEKASIADFITWQTFISIFIPLGATLILALNLHSARALPQLTGQISVLSIVLIAVFTLLNIIFTYLTFGEMTLGILGLLLVNLIAFALWHKHMIFLYWMGMNLSPITWMVYRLWL